MKRVIISGGGTGGHIFPAIAIADEIRRQFPDVHILFVGAEGKMEMEKVPQAGYKIIGLPIAGLQRKLTAKNLSLPFKIFKSMMMARATLKEFKPEIAIGVGGYASGPTLKMANLLNIPTVLQEQNSFAGKTNKLLGKKAEKICVAYEGMEKFFPKNKIVVTGNPVRSEVAQIEGKRASAFEFYGLDPQKPTLLIIGGSLGAKTLNDSMLDGLDKLQRSGIQTLWQCGKLYYNQLSEAVRERNMTGIKLTEFIARMDYAYAMSDVIISRAGAISVSELTLVAKPVILVPSPNVAEDHQTHNAMALVNKEAALIVKDKDARTTLIDEAIALIQNKPLQEDLSKNIAELGKPNATADIVAEIVAICKKRNG
ncbi:MAG TPA: undecaprenyldiphospho-muramoylpentapeptide beta-N-acetylglucosaminyltransferase [Taishania sp.]|nr:undecaprenyldiphospho-muramoylpentapeptide beta-N-acetylglucosaminyltransferase [Taishania sp.]